jgi:hypothetical protein
MIEAPFGFFEVVIEVLPANAAKFCQAQFGVAPEGLNAVDMTTVSGKFGRWLLVRKGCKQGAWVQEAFVSLVRSVRF